MKKIQESILTVWCQWRSNQYHASCYLLFFMSDYICKYLLNQFCRIYSHRQVVRENFVILGKKILGLVEQNVNFDALKWLYAIL